MSFLASRGSFICICYLEFPLSWLFKHFLKFFLFTFEDPGKGQEKIERRELRCDGLNGWKVVPAAPPASPPASPEHPGVSAPALQSPRGLKFNRRMETRVGLDSSSPFPEQTHPLDGTTEEEEDSGFKNYHSACENCMFLVSNGSSQQHVGGCFFPKPGWRPEEACTKCNPKVNRVIITYF